MTSFSHRAAGHLGGTGTVTLEETDLTAAVAQGTIDQAQAAALRELAHARIRERGIALGHEERFRFLRGFNDVFLAIGVSLVYGGMIYLAEAPATVLGVAAAIWVLAELLVRHMRLALPGIMLAFFFVWTIYYAVPAGWWFQTPIPMRMLAPASNGGPLDYVRYFAGNAPLYLAAKAAAAAVAAGLFFLRFKLPFALLMLAGALVAFGVTLSAHFVPPFALPALQNTIVLTFGVAVFAAAMGYDVSDRERLSSRADCAFWLHLVAAPLIVQGMVGLVTHGMWRMTPSVAAEVALIVLLLAAVAVVIDRRALLVSGLSSLGAAITYVLSVSGGGSYRPAFAGTLLLLGALVLTLGIAWLPLRKRLVSLLPATIVNSLPPVPARP